MESTKPSAVEIENAKKVLEFLSEMKGISYTLAREDIFQVKSNETSLICIVDVEPSIVCLSIEVCDVPEEYKAELDDLFMVLNGQAIHGKFVRLNKKYYFRDNLEFLNLDFNELEASLKWSFGMVGGNISKIANIYNTGEVGNDIDFEDDEIDLEELMDAGETIADYMEVTSEFVEMVTDNLTENEKDEPVEEVVEETFQDTNEIVHDVTETPVYEAPEASVRNTFVPETPDTSYGSGGGYDGGGSDFGGGGDSGGGDCGGGGD